MEYCLGIELLGTCNYDPDNPSRIYFSIGNMMPALMIIFVMGQILSPVTKMRFRTKFFDMKKSALTFLIAVGCVFAAAIVPIISGKPYPIIGYPYFWEIMGGFFFILASCLSVLSMMRPSKYSKRNYKIYFNEVVNIMEVKDPQHLVKLAEGLLITIPYLIKQSMKKNECGKYARYLLEVFSDDEFCKILVTRTPEVVIKIIDTLIKSQSYKESGQFLMRKIINNSFANQNSFLYSETINIDYLDENLTNKEKFLSLICTDYDVLYSNINPLKSWKYNEDNNITPIKIRKYLTALKLALITYFNNRDFNNFPSPIFRGLNSLSELCEMQCKDLIKDPDLIGSNSSNSYLNVLEIFSGIVKLIRIVEKNEIIIPKRAIETGEYPTIYGVFARGIYECLSNLSILQNYDQQIYAIASNLWNIIYPETNTESRTVDEIQKRLDPLFEEQLVKNLKLFEKPNLIRLVLNLDKLKTDDSPLIGLLKEYFQQDFQRNESEAMAMLPNWIEYNPKKNSITIKSSNLSESDRIINL